LCAGEISGLQTIFDGTPEALGAAVHGGGTVLGTDRRTNTKETNMSTNEKQIALITGAGRSTGIGFAAARQLAEKGFAVVLSARKLADAQARASELAASGLDVTSAGLDVTDAKSIDDVALMVEGRFGKLDVLINNAAATTAYGETASAADLSVALKILQTTLLGNWAVAKAFLPLLRKSKHARLVNVSSGAGSHADPVFGLTTANAMGPSYAVAKAALNALTVRLALENPAMRVNAVCPGFTATFEGASAMGARPVAEGAASVVWAALIPDDGPTAGFFRDGHPLGW
jgi:NAD(P)-dependent dehydrogenase (short-subunit alcohol dehydrogenase family)